MNRTLYLITAYVLLALLCGATRQYINPGAETATSDLPFMITGLLLIFIWYYFDTEQIQFERSALLNLGVILIGIIALPYYFLKSRGFMKGMVYTGLFLLVIMAWPVNELIGAYLIYYGLQS